MYIMIWDIDWFCQVSQIPNMDCMQISSYHKQLGDSVSLAENEFDLSLKYDIIYICKNSKATKTPSRKLIDDPRTRLIGSGFKYFKIYELPRVIYCCRPDYLLYPQAENKTSYTNANFIRFYWKKELIEQRQDFHNAKKQMKRLIVWDGDEFWKASEKNIIYCLDTLKSEKNIVFLNPISIKRVVESKNIQEKFLSLNFSAGTDFKWRNDLGSSEEAGKRILEFLAKLQERTKSKLGFIPLKAVETPIVSHEEAFSRFLECLKIICTAKQQKIIFRPITPKDSTSIPHWTLFKLLENWMTFSPKISLIEYMTHNLVKQHGTVWYNILNDSSKWTTSLMDELLRFLGSKTYENFRPLFFCQWGVDNLNERLVNYNIIEQNVNLLYKEID